MLLRLPTSLFGKTALTIAAVLILFQVFTTAVIAYYLLVPVARRSANDLADFMILSSRTWVSLPVEERKEFEAGLHEKTGLRLFAAEGDLPGKAVYLPYALFLADELSKQTQGSVQIGVEQIDGLDMYWVDFNLDKQLVRVGFPGQRINIHAPLAILLILLLGTVLALLTALILARRWTQPLSLLSNAAERIGHGGTPEPLPEIGPSELANLARTFNKMALQVKSLLANQTTLLAGIAHDLRTPIARMRLALEVLPASTDPELNDRLLRGLDNMARLVDQALELGCGVAYESPQTVNVAEMINELVDEARRDGADISVHHQGFAIRVVALVALRRILYNLLDNAVHYGIDHPIDITCTEVGERFRFNIADRGPGIPADELHLVFEPFYRVDKSRSSATGGSGLGLAVAKQLAVRNRWVLNLALRKGGGMVASLTI